MVARGAAVIRGAAVFVECADGDDVAVSGDGKGRAELIAGFRVGCFEVGLLRPGIGAGACEHVGRARIRGRIVARVDATGRATAMYVAVLVPGADDYVLPSAERLSADPNWSPLSGAAAAAPSAFDALR